MEKLNSGIEGLDQLLYGGFPKGRAYLLSGEPGTGKTLFSLQFLIAGLKKGEKGIFISIDETPQHILQDALAVGWDLRPYLESGHLTILDVSQHFSSSGNESRFNGDKIIEDILNYIQKTQATRVAIDPIAPIIFSENTINNVAEYIRKLIFALEAPGNLTTLLSSYVPVGSGQFSQHGVEEFAASGIIVLGLSKTKGKYIRSLWIRKMRGTQIDMNEYSFEIITERGVIVRQPIQ